jgi:hypothetical protein
VYVAWQREMKRRSPWFVTAMVSGYRLNHGRYLFESVLTLRKWAVILIAAVIKDPVLSVLCTLGLSLIVWSTVAFLKPYSDVQNQKLVRIAHSVMVSQTVCWIVCLARIRM